MKVEWSARLTLLVFMIIMFVSFFLWVFLLFALWLVLRIMGASTNLWMMIESLSTAIAASAVLSAGFVAYRELSEIASGRHIDVADRLFNELNSSENVKARRWIYQNLPNDPGEGFSILTPEGQDAVKKVLNSLDRVAFLTQSGWIPDNMIMPWMNPMIVKVWEKLGPYVDYESKRRHEPDYYIHARELAERCISWRINNIGDSQITWVKNAL